MTKEEENEEVSLAKEFIENLFYDMAKHCTKYDNDSFSDMPYTYGERQLDSILLPSLSKLCKSMVFTEYPVIRQCKNRKFNVDKSNGWLDYWCIYKGYSFIIELKHSYDCFTTPKTRENTVIKPWIKMNEQLDSLEKALREFGEKTRGVIRIGLHIITSYSDKIPDDQLLKRFNDNIPKTFERLQKDLGKQYPSLKPDLIICWTIPLKIVMCYEQTFPGLWAVAKIYPKIDHKGAKS